MSSLLDWYSIQRRFMLSATILPFYFHDFLRTTRISIFNQICRLDPTRCSRTVAMYKYIHTHTHTYIYIFFFCYTFIFICVSVFYILYSMYCPSLMTELKITSAKVASVISGRSAPFSMMLLMINWGWAKFGGRRRRRWREGRRRDE